jgi:hypothetical protein
VLLKIQPGHPRACEVQHQSNGRSFLAKISNTSPRILWAVVLVGLALLAALIFALTGHQ